MGGDAFVLVFVAVIGVVKVAQIRAQLRHLEVLVRDLRSAAIMKMTYEPLVANQRALLDGLEVPPGMVALGDFLEVLDGRGTSGAVRGFADLGGTLFGWLGRVGAMRVVVMVLFSATESDVYMTRLTPPRAGSLAAPPFLH